jgi:two-component system, cell cycle response regulator
MAKESKRGIHSGEPFIGVRKTPFWRILLVDDEPTQRLIMARLLKRAGFEVDTADNGREALAKIRDGNFQLLITDWDMPEMDGITLCKTVRSFRDAGYIYIIMLNARDSIADVVAGLESGADDYLTKPVIEPELIARLNTGKRIVTLERSLHAANEENRRLAVTHPLTGVYNRLHLMTRLPIEVDDATRCVHPLTVVVWDIDDFKGVNDKYGHIVGSEVLVAMAKLLAPHIALARGWFAHHGGDEFIAVLPAGDLNAARSLAESLRSAMSNTPLLINGVEIRVTASFGVSGWDGVNQPASSTNELLQFADRAVYESKAGGRNCVSVKPVVHPGPAYRGSDPRASGVPHSDLRFCLK